MHNREWPKCLLAATAETRKQVQSLKGIFGTVSKQCQKQGCGQKLGEIIKLLTQHSLAEWLSFFEELSGEDGLVMEGLRSFFTTDLLYCLHGELLRLLKSCLNQFSQCHKFCSHPLGPTGKRKKPSLLKLLLLNVCNGTLTQAENEACSSLVDWELRQEERNVSLEWPFHRKGPSKSAGGKASLWD